MSAHTVVSVLAKDEGTNLREVIFTATGSASYDAGGSVINLGTGGVLGVANGFVYVYGVTLIAVAAASSKYQCVFVPGSSYAAATGLIKIHDSSQAADAETSGDLSSVTFTFSAVGR